MPKLTRKTKAGDVLQIDGPSVVMARKGKNGAIIVTVEAERTVDILHVKCQRSPRRCRRKRRLL